MVNLKYITALILLLIAVIDCHGQSKSAATSLRQKNTYQSETSNQPKTERNRNELTDGNIQWLRVVYRDLDLSQSPNGTLKNTSDNSKDLFSILLNLISNNKIKAYEYQDGVERFDEQTMISAKSLSDRFDISFNSSNSDDIILNDIERYYIIEHYFFDNRSSQFKREVKAICPVLERGTIASSSPVRYPLFWVIMDDIRPYINTVMIMTDDNNNVVRHSIDNFFELNIYKGDLYKTQNTTNKTLVQLYPDPNDLANARDSIENSLIAFEKGLWTPAFNRQANPKAVQSKADIQKPVEQKSIPSRAGAIRSVRRKHSDS